jgi:hypothetical protein
VRSWLWSLYCTYGVLSDSPKVAVHVGQRRRSLGSAALPLDVRKVCDFPTCSP